MSRNQTRRIAVYIAIALVGMLVITGLGLGALLWFMPRTADIEPFTYAF